MCACGGGGGNRVGLGGVGESPGSLPWPPSLAGLGTALEQVVQAGVRKPELGASL